MTADCFLDTNIVLYAASHHLVKTEKRRIAAALIKGEHFGLSAQVLQEFYVNVTRKTNPSLSPSRAHAWIQRLSVFPCVEIDSGLVTLGIAASERFQISYWDGAIVAAAEVLGASILYTEDLSHGQRYGSVTVVNPFRDLRV